MADPRYSWSVPRHLGHYRLGRMLGSGGMGTVFEGEDRRDGSRVAIKLLHPHLASVPGFRDRFIREAHVAAILRSPYTVRLLDYGVEGGRCFLVTDYVQGETLASALETSRMGPRRAVRIAVQIARALEEAEARGIVHRDIKPENVLLGAGDSVKVSDFGLARQLESAGVTAFMGTVLYGAPELADGRADHRTDIYALGATLYQSLSGHPPFSGTILHLLDQHRSSSFPIEPLMHLPKPLRDLVRKCMEKNPDRRFQSASQVAHALERVGRMLDGDLTGAFLPEDASPPPPRGARRVLMNAMSAVALGIAFALVLAASGTLHANAPGKPREDPASVALDRPQAAATAEPPAPRAAAQATDTSPAATGTPEALAASRGAQVEMVATPSPSSTPVPSPTSLPAELPRPSPVPTEAPKVPTEVPKPTSTPAAPPSPTPSPTQAPAVQPLNHAAAGEWAASLQLVHDTCTGLFSSKDAPFGTFTLSGSSGAPYVEDGSSLSVSVAGALLGPATLAWPVVVAGSTEEGKLMLYIEFTGPSSANVRAEQRYAGRSGRDCTVVFKGAAIHGEAAVLHGAR